MFRAERLLAHGADVSPHQTLVSDGAAEWSYRRLDDWAAALAATMAARGLGEGSRVGILAANGPEYIASLFAALKIGALAMPFHVQCSASELQELIHISRPELVLLDAGRDTAIAGPPTLTVSENANGSAVVSDALPRTARLGGPDAPAVVLFTSGSTGRSKGVVLSHGNIVANAVLCAPTLRLTCSDNVFTCVPMTHAYGQNRGLLSPMAARAGISITRNAATTASLIAAIQQARPSVLIAVPNVYAVLVAVPDQSFPTLRVAVSGAATLSPSVRTRFEQRFGVPVVTAYGATEASPVIASGCLDVPQIEGSVGHPLLGIDIELRDADDSTSVKCDEGRLFVRGHNVMSGYLDDPEATAKVLDDGWLDTGDVARRNPDGSLSILGRLSGMAKRNGFRVFPAEVEAVIRRHADVIDCVVRVNRNPLAGDDLVADVVLRGGSALVTDDLKSFCADQLAAYKVPSGFRVKQSLDVTAAGKTRS